MSIEQTLATLIETATKGAAEDMRALRRVHARIRWVRDTTRRLAAAQKRVDKAWEEHFERIEAEGLDDGAADALPEPAAQAEVDAILAELSAVQDKDLWPRALYFAAV